MRTHDDSPDDDGPTVFEVGLDDATVARLMEVADLSHTTPRAIIASIVHDVLLDDELHHHAAEPDRPNLN